MPSIIQPSPRTTTTSSSAQKQPGIEQFLQQPKDNNSLAEAQSPAKSSATTPKSSRKKMTAKEKADSEVLDRRNKKKSKDKSIEARAARKLARAQKREEKLSNRRGVTGDGSDRRAHDGDERMTKASTEIPDQQNPLLVPLPEENPQMQADPSLQQQGQQFPS